MKNYVCLVFAVFVLVVPALAQTTNPNYEVTFLSEPPLGKAGWDRPRSVAADGNGLVYVLRPSDPPFSTEPQTPVIVFNRARRGRQLLGRRVVPGRPQHRYRPRRVPLDHG